MHLHTLLVRHLSDKQIYISLEKADLARLALVIYTFGKNLANYRY